MVNWKSFFTESNSFMEDQIAKILNKKKVIYHREVAFRNFKSPRGQYYRFDFYLPDRNLIIEYDGWFHLKDKAVIKNDKIKNKFCKKRGIRLARLNKKHIRNLEKELKKILK